MTQEQAVLVGGVVALALALGSVVSAVLMRTLPVMRKGVFFGVRVPDGFETSPPGLSILRRYHRWNILLAVAGWIVCTASALLWWFGVALELSGKPILTEAVGLAGVLAGAALHGAGIVAAMQEARRRVLPHAVNDSAASIRVADVGPETRIPSWMPLLWLLPALLLAGVVIYMAADWSRIPDRIPAWGAPGTPVRWIDRSLWHVFGPLLPAVSALVMCYGVSAITLFGARRSGADMRRLQATAAWPLLITTHYVLTQGLSVLSSRWAPDVLQASRKIMTLAPVPLLVIIAAIGVRHWWAGRSDTGSPPDVPGDCWRLGGTVYVNRTDPAWAVRAVIGPGYALNMGHPVVRLVVPLLILQFLVVMSYVVFVNFPAR